MMWSSQCVCAQVVDAAGLPEGARKVLSYHRAEADELVSMQPSNEGTDLPFRILYMLYVNVSNYLTILQKGSSQ